MAHRARPQKKAREPARLDTSLLSCHSEKLPQKLWARPGGEEQGGKRQASVRREGHELLLPAEARWHGHYRVAWPYKPSTKAA